MTAGLDPRTPVLVGAAAVTQHPGDPSQADDAVDLMVRALRSAGDDAGRPRLLGKADIVMAPQPSWECADPARMVAQQLGITPHTLCAELGVLQQTLFSRACTEIAAGHASVVLVTGGEARARAASAARKGIEVPPEPQSPGPADTVISPQRQVISKLEIKRQLFVAARQYAIIETAIRAASGESVSAHAKKVAALWDRFADVARTRPEAWKRDAPSLGSGDASEANPWYAWPYTKQHCSYWTVDQAAGFVLCSVAAAEAAGISRDRWVFPVAAAESNAMVMLSERAEPFRSPAIAATARAITELTGEAPDAADFVDIYSCFPAAVQVQAAEMGLGADRPLTVTGGMTFGGGPLNNYVLQSTSRMAAILRENAGATGLVTSISGMITKQAIGVWSTTPPAAGFRSADVTTEALDTAPKAHVDGEYSGAAEVVGYTVAYDKAGPSVGILVAKTPNPQRTHAIATTSDPQLLADMTANEWVGRAVTVNGDQLTG